MHLIIAKFLVFPTSLAIAVGLSIEGNADAELAPGTVTNRVDFPSGAGPISVDVADLDGDGLPDVVVSNYTDGTLSVFQNAGAGVMSKTLLDKPFNIKLPGSAFRVVLVDLDRDGRVDILAAMHNKGQVLFLRNLHQSGALSTSSFAAPFEISAPGTSGFLCSGDVDGDGLTDLLVGDSDVSRSILVLRQTGLSPTRAPLFDPPVMLPTGEGPSDSVLADLDGDGRPDLITPDGHGTSIAIYQNLSTRGVLTPSSFSARIDLPSGLWPQTVAVADIDRDGRPDIASVNSSPGTISIYRNIHLGGPLKGDSFAPALTIGDGHTHYAVRLVDLDGDGKPELLATDGTVGSVQVYRNIALPGPITKNSFAPVVAFPSGGNAVSLVVRDLNQDGAFDLVTANLGGGGVSILAGVRLPKLSYEVSGSVLVLLWPTNASAFALETATGWPITNWARVHANPLVFEGHNLVPVPMEARPGYFRLGTR